MLKQHFPRFSEGLADPWQQILRKYRPATMRFDRAPALPMLRYVEIPVEPCRMREPVRGLRRF